MRKHEHGDAHASLVVSPTNIYIETLSRESGMVCHLLGKQVGLQTGTGSHRVRQSGPGFVQERPPLICGWTTSNWQTGKGILLAGPVMVTSPLDTNLGKSVLEIRLSGQLHERPPTPDPNYRDIYICHLRCTTWTNKEAPFPTFTEKDVCCPTILFLSFVQVFCHAEHAGVDDSGGYCLAFIYQVCCNGFLIYGVEEKQRFIILASSQQQYGLQSELC